MALKVVIDGIQEFYHQAKEEEKEEGTLHSKEFCTKLLPRVKVLRLTSQTIKTHTAEEMRLENIPCEDDCSAMFDEEDSYPFLGFGRYGEPTVQLPKVTRSLKKDLDTPMEDSETQRTSLNKDKTKKKIVRGKKRNRSIANKRRAAVTVQPKIASVTVQPKIASVTVQPKIASVTVQPKIASVTVQPKIASVTVQPKIASITVQPKIASVTVQPKIVSSNKASPDADDILGDPKDLPEARNDLTEDVFSSFSTTDIHELQLSIKDEIDDDDITIETEDFDYSYNVNERLLSPSSDRLRHAAPENHNMSHLNNNCGLSSGNLNDCVFREHSGQKTNGLSRPNNLTELTTLLLELNNKNNTLEKKLAILKKAYETKTAKILQEKKTNEKKIQFTLQKIQSWRDDPESSCVESRLSSPARSNTGTSSQARDVHKSSRRGGGASARKRTGKTAEKVTRHRLSGKAPSSSREMSGKLGSSYQDPEPIVSIVDMLGEEDLIEYEDSGSVESIDAEIVCMSDFYKSKNDSFCNLDSLDTNSEDEEVEIIKDRGRGTKRTVNNMNLIREISALKPVVCLSDIYAKKRTTYPDMKCGSYVVVKLSSKKSVKHYCAVVRNIDSGGEYEVQYMERKNTNEFIFPEKEMMYRIDVRDVVRVLQEPSVNLKGSRLYYSFPDNLDGITSLT